MDFRELKVIAGKEEEFVRDDGEVPVNRVRGEYDTLDEYLGTHFRLLREDLTTPYRHALVELRRRAKQGWPGGAITDIQVYNKVKLVGMRPEHGGVEYALRIGEIQGQNDHIDWFASKLLMHNSLVCISCNGFEKFQWAVVSTRRYRQLQQNGVIGVRPLDLHGFGSKRFGDLTKWILRDREYTMFESTSAFFEAYQHVLDVLRRKEMEKMEFLEHLVFLKQQVDGPEYLAVAQGFEQGSSVGWEQATPRGIKDAHALLWETWPSEGSHGGGSGDSDGMANGENVEIGEDTKIGKKVCYQQRNGSGKGILELDEEGLMEILDENSFRTRRTNDGGCQEESFWGRKSLEVGESSNAASRGVLEQNGDDAWDHDGLAQYDWKEQLWGPGKHENCEEVAGLPGEDSSIEIDQSQQDAINHGLSKKLALIQGPAGTGKTFVGLQIAKRLLSNGKIPKPLIVVCYTNRALDQFLEGVYKFETSLVRLGTGSKSPVLNDCSFENFRKKFKIRIPKELNREKGKLRLSQEELADQLNFCGDCMGMEVVNKTALSKVAKKEHIKSLYFCNDCHEDDIYKSWLDGNTNVHVSYSCPKCISSTYECTESSMEFHRLDDAVDDSSIIELIMSSCEGDNVWNMPVELRHSLHNHWLFELHQFGCKEFSRLASEYEGVCRKIAKVKMKIQLGILSSARVLGMTTTVAARYFDLLTSIKPAVMIVEEAAEVLEAQLLACINPHIKHLILIGDHMQLRPSLASTQLGPKNQLDISMFERLIKNGIEYKTLQVQRRMRPAVAYLAGRFYPFVHDHRSVQSLEDVRGIQHNVFFFDHEHIEECADNSGSKVNRGEAALVVEFALYLVNICGYSWQDITILSMYRCQINEISRQFSQCLPSSKKRRRAINNGGDMPKVRSVDEFQGEESDIIILSLVRNKTDSDQWLDHYPRSESIGFLGNPNRICVALTRARLGLFMFGNSNLLCSKSNIWDDIVEKLSKNGWIGSRLKLRCPIHSDIEFRVRTTLEIQAAACPKKCECTLLCNHSCPRKCHYGDHKDILCDKMCNVKLRCGHSCQLPCHFEDLDKCYPCSRCRTTT